MEPAEQAIERCRRIASFTDQPGFTTRTFLSPAAREVQTLVAEWMRQAGMSVRVDAAGNLRGTRAGIAPRVILGSHLDTVPRAGAFDGILGVTMAIALSETTDLSVEVVGFSEEEGVRFATPFLGSLALTGELDHHLLARTDASGTTVAQAIRDFGLDPALLPQAVADADQYFEFHIEQGPVLDDLGLPLAIVEGIAGQSRSTVKFEGQGNHAGTTPMNRRRDALAGAAEWILAVERQATAIPGLTATVGRIDARPGGSNVIPGSVTASLDVRHANDVIRRSSESHLIACAAEIAARRSLLMHHTQSSALDTVPMNQTLTRILEQAVRESGFDPHRMFSGAGHDAMIMARRFPSAMLFLRSPGGVSHHPDETVRADDVAAALTAGRRFLEILGERGV